MLLLFFALSYVNKHLITLSSAGTRGVTISPPSSAGRYSFLNVTTTNLQNPPKPAAAAIAEEWQSDTCRTGVVVVYSPRSSLCWCRIVGRATAIIVFCICQWKAYLAAGYQISKITGTIRMLVCARWCLLTTQKTQQHTRCRLQK